MGLLRFSLAFLVVYGHCGSPFGGIGLSAQHAVQSFYLISGFYMTLVLREKYGRDAAGIKSFYLNRWLRLYPTYMVVLGLALLLCFASNASQSWQAPPQSYLRDWSAEGVLGWPRIALMSVSQLTMIGLDLFNLLTLQDNGTLALTYGATADRYPLWRLLLVPQAWSLSIELYFYALAPFLVMRGVKTLFLFALASFCIRLLLFKVAGYHLDPWSYRFFPSELMFFLAGGVAYHVYANTEDLRAMSASGRTSLYVSMGAMILVSVWMARIDQPISLRSLIPPVFTLAVFAAIPVLFRLTRDFKGDRLVGELSYPVYISHILIIWLVGQGSYHTGKVGFLVVSGLTIAFSYALYRWIDVPIDAYRHRKLSPTREGNQQVSGGIRTAPVSGA